MVCAPTDEVDVHVEGTDMGDGDTESVEHLVGGAGLFTVGADYTGTKLTTEQIDDWRAVSLFFILPGLQCFLFI